MHIGWKNDEMDGAHIIRKYGISLDHGKEWVLWTAGQRLCPWPHFLLCAFPKFAILSTLFLFPHDFCGCFWEFFCTIHLLYEITLGWCICLVLRPSCISINAYQFNNNFGGIIFKTVAGLESFSRFKSHWLFPLSQWEKILHERTYMIRSTWIISLFKKVNC